VTPAATTRLRSSTESRTPAKNSAYEASVKAGRIQNPARSQKLHTNIRPSGTSTAPATNASGRTSSAYRATQATRP